MKRYLFLFCFCNYFLFAEKIDVVIPCAEKDISTLDLCIDGIRENCKQVQNIYLVSAKQYSKKAVWIDESKYPFSKKDILSQLNHKKQEGIPLGWIYQQLLKFYAPKVIKNLSENFLVLDADTIFLNQVDFIDQNGCRLYNYGFEYNYPYFVHAQKLIPNFKKFLPVYSGITHSMLFEQKILNDLFATVEKYHKTLFWKAFCSVIEERFIYQPCASEYEIYFNYTLSHSSRSKIRYLKWANIHNIKLINKFKKRNYHFVTLHNYLR